MKTYKSNRTEGLRLLEHFLKIDRFLGALSEKSSDFGKPCFS
jgi:hypothetical protein